jgi:hypothetical protein
VAEVAEDKEGEQVNPMRREKPNIKVTVKWQRIEGEPPPLWSKLWDKLLAPRKKNGLPPATIPAKMRKMGRKTPS